MAKAPEAFRNISEVADELGVPKHVLRFWEQRFPQIKPMKRGGGRRFYRPADVELLRGIHRLLQTEGYTIKGVQKILREHGIDGVRHVEAAATPASPAVGLAESITEPPSTRRRPRQKSATAAAAAPTESATGRLIATAIAELKEARRLLTEPAGSRRPRPS